MSTVKLSVSQLIGWNHLFTSGSQPGGLDPPNRSQDGSKGVKMMITSVENKKTPTSVSLIKFSLLFAFFLKNTVVLPPAL